jgi:hypothetical protein
MLTRYIGKLVNRRDFGLCLTGGAGALFAGQAGSPARKTVRAKKRPQDAAWIPYPTRALEDLEGFAPGAAKIRLGKYGGRADRRRRATGFFRVEQIGARWWLIDPEGCPWINSAICSVAPGRSDRSVAALNDIYGTPERWAEAATELLRGNAFNSSGAWSAVDLLRGVSRPVPWYSTLSFLGNFAKSRKLALRKPGHVGFVNDCPPLFHPEFAAFCDTYARDVARTKNDPLLVGHFSDNELPAPGDLLDRSLQLDGGNPELAPGAEAARSWLARRKGSGAQKSITDADREAFLEYAYDRYLELTCGALRKYDPNHLCLGPRLWGPSMRVPGILRACGRHLDVVAVNIYFQWQPEAELLDMWRSESGKPFLVTEFYAKGEDSGLPNTTGAGWLVPTQNDRGLFYQHFTMALLESRQCVGWHWLTYQDNDPENPKAELSNLDSNKGVVNVRYEPYTPLLRRMKALNANLYALCDFFDKR